MADKSNSPKGDQRGSSWFHSAVVPLIAAAIIGVSGIVAVMIGRGTTNQTPPSETTTVFKTVPAPESQTPASPQSQQESPDTATAACLQSNARGDAEDNSMGTSRGPLIPGKMYRGTLIKGDQEWWGFCARRPGRVDIKVENICNVEGRGATNMLAEILDSSGEQLESFRPEPGRFDSIPLQVEANTPYYVHIYDLYDIDIGDGVCGEVSWALTVTGELTSEVSS